MLLKPREAFALSFPGTALAGLSYPFLSDMPGHDSGLCTSMCSNSPIHPLRSWPIPSDAFTPGMLDVTSCNVPLSQAERFAERPLRLCPGSPRIEGVNQ